MEYLEVAGGLVVLVAAGDVLVRGAVALASRLGVSVLFIGLTVVAFGTSAPELVVGIDAVLTGAPTLALGNVVGSNIANILLVLGAPALISSISCATPGLQTEMVAMLLASLALIGLSFLGPIGTVSGLILLSLLALYLYTSWRRATIDPAEAEARMSAVEQEVPLRKMSGAKASVYVVLGLAGLVVGAHFLVDGAVVIARNFGVSEAVIGLTLVAIGTSLPELATALMAAYHKHGDVVVGNVIGSNIFNVLGIVGGSSQFGRIPIPREFLMLDYWVMLSASLILVPFIWRDGRIGKRVGLAFLLAYGGYMAWLAMSAETPLAPGEGV